MACKFFVKELNHMQPTLNREANNCPDQAVARSEGCTQYELLSASPGVLATPDGRLSGLAARVAAADAAADRPVYRLEGTEIVQILAPAAFGPTYFVHYTPSRADRPQHPSGCPICLDRVRGSGQNYAVIRIRDWELTVLSNPFGYMPTCITWATRKHLPQSCGSADQPNSWHSVFELMLQLCSRLGDHVVGFNELAGNSLDHLHLVSHQPVNGLGPYGVQQSAARLSRRMRWAVAQVGIAQGYPIELWRVGLSDIGAAAAAGAALIERWTSGGGPSASANSAAVIEDGHPVLYIFPRCGLLRARGWLSPPAVMEMMGVFIASNPDEMMRVRDGRFDHHHFSAILSSLRPPLLSQTSDFRVTAQRTGGSSSAHKCAIQANSVDSQNDFEGGA
jgi:hypothetical protein